MIRVVAFLFRLHPVDTVYGGAVLWHPEHAADETLTESPPWVQARAEALDGGALIMIAGSGPLRAELEARIAALQLGDTVPLQIWVLVVPVQTAALATDVSRLPSPASARATAMDARKNKPFTVARACVGRSAVSLAHRSWARWSDRPRGERRLRRQT